MKYSKFLSTILLLVVAIPAMAWGPHSKITEAALDTLPPDDAFMKCLGDNAGQMIKYYCWMGDYRLGVMAEPDGSMYLADDYLLYPKVARHVGHICPEMETVLEPYFQRAVQALRTETPANAMRWVGTIVHFAQDGGAPPHAAGVWGEVHGRMEQWVNNDQIALGDYKPRLLGSDQDEAFQGCMKRIRDLVLYARVRGERLKPIAEAGNRQDSEPIILDCALETARVTADVMHTLGATFLPEGKPSTLLRGRVSPSRPGLPVAKIVLLGTDYSTLADASGNWEFRNLPPGTYDGRIVRPGSRVGRFHVRLTPGCDRVVNTALTDSEPRGNLFRNSDFAMRWIASDPPDDWYKADGGWQSNVVPVTAGGKFRLSVSWKPGVEAKAVLVWYKAVWAAPENTISRAELASTESELEVIAPESAKIAQLITYTSVPVADASNGVALVHSAEYAVAR